MRCVILSGYFEGDLNAVYRPEPGDFLLAADRGLELAQKARLTPDYFIGDCDSLSSPFEGNGRILPTHKDDTDTIAALKEGLARGYREFLILGALGGRLDGVFADLPLRPARHPRHRPRPRGAMGLLPDPLRRDDHGGLHGRAGPPPLRPVRRAPGGHRDGASRQAAAQARRSLTSRSRSVSDS